jgi:YCII-related domain
MDGPFAETKELVAGYWILQCKSLADTIEWIKRCSSWTTSAPARLSSTIAGWANRLPTAHLPSKAIMNGLRSRQGISQGGPSLAGSGQQ